MPVLPAATDPDTRAPSEPESGEPEHAVSALPAFGILLTVAYDGRRFSGWARQTNARSVAGELEGAIAAIDPKASKTRGLSRTDAGVHAREQLVAFDTDKDVGLRGWVLALSQHL